MSARGTARRSRSGRASRPFPAASPAMSWCSAECSESTGITCAPVASASCITSSPPTTSDSLLASARSIPSPSVATVGPRPAEPTSALRTMSAPESTTSATRPSAPSSTSPLKSARALAAASGSVSAIRVTRELARLRDELLPAALRAQPDELELVGVRDDLERLGPDRPGGAEDEQAAGHAGSVAEASTATRCRRAWLSSPPCSGPSPSPSPLRSS